MSDLVDRLKDRADNVISQDNALLFEEAAACIASLRAALEPFAKLGGAYVKYGPSDNSPFADAPNDIIIQVGATYQRGWTVTVGELRAAATSFYGGTP